MNRKHIFILLVIVCIVSASLILMPGINKQDINLVNDRELYAGLVDIKGIGPVTAKSVVEYRQAHKSIVISELDRIDGIGPKRLKIIKSEYKD